MYYQDIEENVIKVKYNRNLIILNLKIRNRVAV